MHTRLWPLLLAFLWPLLAVDAFLSRLGLPRQGLATQRFDRVQRAALPAAMPRRADAWRGRRARQGDGSAAERWASEQAPSSQSTDTWEVG